MPRYHFNVYDNRTSIDKLGTVLPDEQSAREEAIRVAGQMVSDERRRLASGEDWFMEVTDGRSFVLFRLDFHVSSLRALHRSARVAEAPHVHD